MMKYINVSKYALYKMLISFILYILYNLEIIIDFQAKDNVTLINYQHYFADCLERLIPDGTLTARHRGTTAAGIRVPQDKENP